MMNACSILFETAIPDEATRLQILKQKTKNQKQKPTHLSASQKLSGLQSDLGA
jgi:hypothetical protein